MLDSLRGMSCALPLSVVSCGPVGVLPTGLSFVGGSARRSPDRRLLGPQSLHGRARFQSSALTETRPHESWDGRWRDRRLTSRLRLSPRSSNRDFPSITWVVRWLSSPLSLHPRASAPAPISKRLSPLGRFPERSHMVAECPQTRRPGQPVGATSLEILKQAARTLPHALLIPPSADWYAF